MMTKCTLLCIETELRDEDVDEAVTQTVYRFQLFTLFLSLLTAFNIYCIIIIIIFFSTFLALQLFVSVCCADLFFSGEN